jgi:heptosyltransferase-2
MNFKNILVIDLSLIGDVLMVTPAVHSLRERYPSARITFMGVPKVLPILKGNSDVSALLPYDKKGKEKGAIGLFRFLAKVRGNHFDAAFIFHRSFGSALIARLMRIPVRVGYSSEGRGLLLTHKYPLPSRRNHLIDEHLALLHAYGIDASSRSLRLEVDDEAAKQFWSTHLSEVPGDLPKVALVAGAQWVTKQWRPEYANEFLNLFDAGTLAFILVGGPEEVPYARRLSCARNPMFNMVGCTTLEELTYILSRVDLVVSPDSGPMHIAGALKRKVIALFGPTDPQRCGLLEGDFVNFQANVNCMKCYKHECNQIPFCMDEIKPEMVYLAAKKMLEKKL